MKYRQLILFGSPGTGKSRKIVHDFLPELGIDPEGENSFRTVFHPEYTYGDFIGKLTPLSRDGKVQYFFHPGFFMQALAQAYNNIMTCPEDEEPQHVALVIDEINRGNSAAIFGTVFQLLDRDEEGWSNYFVNISDMEFDQLLSLFGVLRDDDDRVGGRVIPVYKYRGESKRDKTYKGDDINELLQPLRIRRNQIRIPPNLSLLATMNTSDNSIYYMDAAFKRRWAWQFVGTDGKLVSASGIAFNSRDGWERFVHNLNGFIKRHHRYIRRVEDKQIGYWFIVGDQVTKADVQNKVMFFLWDSVFTTSRKPLSELLGIDEAKLVTFGDFARCIDKFIDTVLTYNERSDV